MAKIFSIVILMAMIFSITTLVNAKSDNSAIVKSQCFYEEPLCLDLGNGYMVCRDCKVVYQNFLTNGGIEQYNQKFLIEDNFYY